MDALLEPPRDFTVELIESTFAMPWYRVHQAAREAVYFDRTPSFRFNAPDGDFGVMYVAELPMGALAETFLSRRRRPPVGTDSDLRRRALSVVSFERPLLLADFTGTGLVSLGLDGRLTNGDCYALARRWSKWIHDHPQGVDGILYPARTAPNQRSAAVFDRVDLRPRSRPLAESLSPASGPIPEVVLAFVEAFRVGIL